MRIHTPMKNNQPILTIALVGVLMSLSGAAARAQVKPEHAGTYDFVYGEKQGPCAGEFGLGVMSVTKTGQITGSYRAQSDGSTGTFTGAVKANGDATIILNDGTRIALKLRGRNVVMVDGDYVDRTSRGFVAGVRR